MARRRIQPRLGKTGCLFWLFIILVIIVIILYRGKGSFKETFSLFKKLSSEEEQVPEESMETIVEDVDKQVPEEQVREAIRDRAQLPEDVGQEPSREPDITVDRTPDQREQAVEEEPEAVRTKSLQAPLYYVKIEGDGSARLQPVIRSVHFIDSPITRTIESLLIGPTAGEEESGLISFIPEGTNLISAQLKNGHLILNFSDNFERNYNGREAIHFQLSQIMLTSFEFRQVTGLSILIDGEKKRYITGEGIPLKEVYTKDDLSLLNTRG
jgi:spore germination protein GerM